MKVHVERCWHGNNNYTFNLVFQRNGRKCSEFIRCNDGDTWDRSYATQAKDFLANVYGLKRDNIRFV